VPPAHPVHHLEDVMGTIVTIDVYAAAEVTGSELDVLRGQLARAQAVLHHADEVFSTWQPDSPVSRLRRGEISLDQAPPEVAEVLEACATARALSHGWFDPWAMPGGVDPTGYVKGWAAQRALAAFSGAASLGAAFSDGTDGRSVSVSRIPPPRDASPRSSSSPGRSPPREPMSAATT
jgi:thiamine biosynthesis lipoprotein